MMLTFVPKIDEFLDQMQLGHICPPPYIRGSKLFAPNQFSTVGTMAPVSILKEIHKEIIVTVENINELPILAHIIRSLGTHFPSHNPIFW